MRSSDVEARRMVCGLALLVLLSAASAMATPQTPPRESDSPIVRLSHAAPFQGRRERPLPGKPEGLCAGDFDGDGKLDLAASLVAPGALLIWSAADEGLRHEFESHPCGDFPLAPVALPRGTFGSIPSAQAIAVVSRAARTLEIVSAAGRRFSLERTPRALAGGRIDGKAVLAIACDGRRLELLRDGSAELELWTLTDDLPRCALVSGALSAVLVGFQDSTAVEAYASDSGSPIGRIELRGIPRAMVEMDVDGDGERELVVAGGDHELWIFGIGRSGGARIWFDRHDPVVWPADAIPTALAVADFDTDGRADLAVLNDFSLSLQVLSQLSASGAGSHPSFYTGQTPCGLAVLDVDADGSLDIAVANRDTQGLGLFLGDGAGSLRAGGILPMGSLPQSLAATRASVGESALRLVVLNAMSNSLSAVVLAEGGLRSLPEVDCGSEPHAPSIAEFDGKPGLDVILLGAGPRGAELRLLHGEPDGHFSRASTLELGGSASDLVLLDLDRDGKAEIAVCDPNRALVVLMENDAPRASPSVLEHAARLHVPGLPLALSAIELDGDAAPELACVLGAPGARVGVAWLDARRDPNGELRLIELGFTALAGAPIDAVACDLDGDERMDLAVLANRAPDSGLGSWHALVRGPRGPVGFAVSEPIATEMLPHAIAAADVDGDRCAEVFVVVENSTLVQVWTPSPSQTDLPFSARALDSLGVGRGPFDLCLSDVDGDGLLDLCTANAFSNDLSVLYGTRR